MAQSDRIPIPISRRLQRLCQLVLPPIGFTLTLWVTLWLWKSESSQGHLLGEVEAVQVEVAVPVAGVLADMPHGQWSLFDAVSDGEIIARLDDAPIKAALFTLDQERTQLAAQVSAAEQEYLLGERTLQQGRQQEFIRLTLEYERLRLDVLDRRTQIAVDQVDLAKRDIVIGFNDRLRHTGVIPEVELIEVERLRDIVRERVQQTTRSLRESTDQALRARRRLDSLANIDVPELTSLLAPLRAAVLVQQARIRELELQLQGLAIRAPMSGIVMEVLRRPGQSVQPGDPVLRLAADHGRYVVSFVRQEMNWRPTEGAMVTMRERRPDGRSANAVVQRIGPQVVPVPAHQLRTQGTPEWGLPVQFALPAELDLAPGELVDVHIRSSRSPPADVQ